jgi:hypothetical protein
MIFEVQQELFFHLATEWLPCGSGLSCFPARNPSRDALSSNFEQVDATHANLRHDMTSLFDIEREQSDAFPSRAAHYTRGHAHLEADRLFYLFLIEP